MYSNPTGTPDYPIRLRLAGDVNSDDSKLDAHDGRLSLSGARQRLEGGGGPASGTQPNITRPTTQHNDADDDAEAAGL